MSRTASSTALLGNAAEWNSGILEPGLADTITGSIFADQAGTIHIEQSGDGTNWDVDTNYAVTANSGKGFSEQIILPYVRVRYVNGATPQTIFRVFVRSTAAGAR